MSTFQNQNQFSMTPELGELVKNPAANVVSVLINPSSVASVIQNGSPCKLIAGVTGQSGMALVDVISDPPNDVVYGFIVYNLRKNTHSPGETVELAIAPSEIWLEASAAITRGVNVQSNASGPTIATNTTSGQQFAGVAIGQVAAAATLINIKVSPGKNP